MDARGTDTGTKLSTTVLTPLCFPFRLLVRVTAAINIFPYDVTHPH